MFGQVDVAVRRDVRKKNESLKLHCDDYWPE